MRRIGFGVKHDSMFGFSDKHHGRGSDRHFGPGKSRHHVRSFPRAFRAPGGYPRSPAVSATSHLSPSGDPATRADLVRGMKSPLLYGLSEGSDISVRETHASLVFLAGNRAYKVKKAVRLPFLDYRDLARRRQLCLDEVRLNSPYAPGTYLGVRAIVPTRAGFRLAGPDDPGAVEYAVEMRRLDEDRTLERLVPAGQADEQLIERVARRISRTPCQRAAGASGCRRPEPHMAADCGQPRRPASPHRLPARPRNPERGQALRRAVRKGERRAHVGTSGGRPRARVPRGPARRAHSRGRWNHDLRSTRI